MTYKLIKSESGEIFSVVDTDKNVCIPFDPDNTDYQAYLKWLADGNTPEAATAATLPAENA